jgi:6-phosphogluconolactonase
MVCFAFDSAAAAAQALAQAVAADLACRLAQSSQVVLALSGGRSPLLFLQALAACDLDWSRVRVTLVDERLVPESHPDSNAALLRRHLLQGRAVSARLVPLVTDAGDAEGSAALACAHYLQPALAVLGMGADGHTASLFPGARELAAALDLKTRPPVIVMTPPLAAHQRLSMTRAALLKCDKLYLAIQGADKRRVFERALRAEDPALPLSCFLQQKVTPLDVYWTP